MIYYINFIKIESLRTQLFNSINMNMIDQEMMKRKYSKRLLINNIYSLVILISEVIVVRSKIKKVIGAPLNYSELKELV